MTYWPRVLRTFSGLLIPGMLLPLVFYYGAYQHSPDITTLASIPGIILLLSLAIPVANDNYARKIIPAESMHPLWKKIIREATENTHVFEQHTPNHIILIKKEHPALQWFYMGRRNTHIIVHDDMVRFYGPGEVSQNLIENTFR